MPIRPLRLLHPDATRQQFRQQRVTQSREGGDLAFGEQQPVPQWSEAGIESRASDGMWWSESGSASAVSSARRRAVNASETYLRKTRPSTTCFYSDASRIPHSLSAASQSAASSDFTGLPLALRALPRPRPLSRYEGLNLPMCG